jgi:sulfite exporter TauE/SafE
MSKVTQYFYLTVAVFIIFGISEQTFGRYFEAISYSLFFIFSYILLGAFISRGDHAIEAEINEEDFRMRVFVVCAFLFLCLFISHTVSRVSLEILEADYCKGWAYSKKSCLLQKEFRKWEYCGIVGACGGVEPNFFDYYYLD